MLETMTVRAHVNEQVKHQATEILSSLGLSVSDAVSAFLDWVVAERRLPFEASKPNAASRIAIAETEEILQRGARFKTASELFDDLEKNAVK